VEVCLSDIDRKVQSEPHNLPDLGEPLRNLGSSPQHYSCTTHHQYTCECRFLIIFHTPFSPFFFILHRPSLSSSAPLNATRNSCCDANQPTRSPPPARSVSLPLFSFPLSLLVSHLTKYTLDVIADWSICLPL